MIDLDGILDQLRTLLPALKTRYPIKELGVFGSWARGQQRSDSDLDIVVDFNGPITLFEFIGLRDDLSDALGMRVDLVVKDAPKPRIRERMLAEAVML